MGEIGPQLYDNYEDILHILDQGRFNNYLAQLVPLKLRLAFYRVAFHTLFRKVIQ